MKNLVLLMLPCILIANTMNGQRLRVGDQVPNLTIKNVINAGNSEVNIADYRGKFLILEFWQTSCKISIKSFGKLDSLQKKFSDFVQILAVNDEHKDSIISFLQRPNIKLPSVPFILEDEVLSQFFPKNFAPWIVWIDKEGIVRHITNGAALSRQTVENFLAGRDMGVSDVQYNGNLLKKGE